jgi:uncharacterized membrane protein YtjA (UPF0391 family)
MRRALRRGGNRVVGSGWRAGAGKGVRSMLTTIAVILLILWLLGLVSSYTLGGFIHILLVIAVVMFLVRLVSGRL